MKAKLLLLFAIVMLVTVAFAQKPHKPLMHNYKTNFYDAVKIGDRYFSEKRKGKGSGYKPYMRWKVENESKFYPTGNRFNVDPDFSSNAFKKFLEANPSPLYKSSIPTTGWIDLGPYSANNITAGYNPGIGRIEALWVNPNNAQQVYLGSRSGGFWKSNDEGANWENTTDFLFASGVNTITGNPNNEDEILINVRNANNGNTHGIYRSLDAGNTWIISAFNPNAIGFGGLGNNDQIFKVVYHPTVANLVFVGTSEGLYVSTDNLATWNQLLNSENIADIEFHPSNNNIIYAIDKGDNIIFRSTDQGVSFTTSNTIAGNNGASAYIAVSPITPNNVWFASSNGIWKSIDDGLNFTFQINPDESCQGFAVSDLDASKQVYGYVDIHVATTNDTTFVKTTFWSNSNPDSSYVHADLRTAECVNGVFYVGTDGYLSKSENNGQTWTRLNDGTSVRESYAFGISQSDHQTMIGGSQDNGTSIYYKGTWIEWNGGDGMEALIHPLNEDWMIGSWQYGTRNITKDGGQTRFGAGAPQSGSSQADWIAPMFLDPNDHMNIYHCSDSIFVSEKFGQNWQYVGSPDIGLIKIAAIANNNSQIIAACRNDDLRLSQDGGATWTNIESNLPSHSITDITFDPSDDNTIIVTYNRHQNDAQKVFITNNLGTTWTNITFNLNDMPIRDVAIDHTADRNIYLGAEIGVYTKPMNGNVWTLYNPDLPNVTVRELEINYGTNELFATTWGRGYWKYDLVGRADYPKILTTDITDTPTDILPFFGLEQFVTSTIVYSGNLTNVVVKWSANNLNFDNVINMSLVANTTDQYVSDTAIPSTNSGDKIYFKVCATGDNNDTSETYKFMYDINTDCSLDDAIITVNPCSDNGTIIDQSDDFYTFNLEVSGNNNSATYSISGDVTVNNLAYNTTHLIDNAGLGFLLAIDINFVITDDNDILCTTSESVSTTGNCFNPNPTCVTAEIINIPGTFEATGPSIGGGANNSNAIDANWFTFIAPNNGEVVVSSCFKGQDTRVWVYDGTCTNLNSIANNDDFCDMALGSNDYASEVTFCVTQGTNYFIEWDDRWTANGFDFDIAFDPTSCAVSCSIIDVPFTTECNNNGTLATPLDDFYEISINPTGVLLGSTYSIAGDYSQTGISYGADFLIPNNFMVGTDANLTITDDADVNCSYNLIVPSTSYCSDCNYNTGNMPTLTKFVCANDTITVSTTTVATGDITTNLIYVLHSSASINSNNMITVSSNGDFINDGTYTTPTTYYISAVISNSFDINGFPDLTNDCTEVSNGKYTVHFLDEIAIDFSETCLNDGSSDIVVEISGGATDLFFSNYALTIPQSNLNVIVPSPFIYGVNIANSVTNYDINISDFAQCSNTFAQVNLCEENLCAEALSIIGVLIDGTYTANQSISVAGNITTASTIEIHAGDWIELEEDFDCNENANLHIYIEGCDNE